MKWRNFLLVAIMFGVLLAGYMYSVAVRDPVVRRLDVTVAAWAQDAQPVRIVLLSDIHVAGPDMPPARLSRIVGKINALKPDIVVLAGDFVSDRALATRHYAATRAIAPLSKLRARLGVVAVMGNHDHWREDALHDPGIFRAALIRAGVHVVDNRALRLGTVVLGGVDDVFTRHADVPATLAAMRRIERDVTETQLPARVMISHSPDIFPQIPTTRKAQDTILVLAGHTHCGQIAPPLIGPVFTASRYGRRYACGVVRERGNILVVGAGLGTSILPFRLGAVPDIWLVTLKGNI